MGISHSITVVISLQYNTENTQKIFSLGKDLGFIYYDQTNDERYFSPPMISPCEAAKLLFNMPKSLIDDGKRYIYARIDDTYLFLYVNNCEEDMELHFVESSYPWRKEFWCGSKDAEYGFDASRYIRVVLKLCKSFKIKKLILEKF